MQNLHDSISYAIDWLIGWDIEIPLDVISGAVEFGIKDYSYFKTAEQFDSRLTNLVKALYNDTIKAPEFVDALGALISRQITLAYREAWKDEGEGEYPEYLATASEAAILAQFVFIDQYARDIVDARIDEKPIDGVLSRVSLWANRYTEAYNNAIALIVKENGGNLVWQYGETEHCDTCRSLNGIVASAKDWEKAGVRPQNAPNSLLDCGGWNCQCALVSTESRRSPKAFERISKIVGAL